MNEPKIISMPIKVRDHKFPVVQHLVDLATQAHDRVLASITSDLHRSLRRARGMEKGFYIDSVRSDDLMKAIKAPKVKKVSAPKAPKAKASNGKKREGVKKPGSRGATKWYRDDHGIIRYGEQPTERFHRELTKDELDAWFKTAKPMFQFGGYEELHDVLMEKFGVRENDLDLLEQISDHLGGMHESMKLEDAFRDMFTVAGEQPEQWHIDKFKYLVEQMEQAAVDADVQKTLRDIAKSEMEATKEQIKDIKETDGITAGAFENWITDKPGAASVKLVATGIEMGVIFPIESKHDVPKELRKEKHGVVWKNLIGRTWGDAPDLEDTVKYADMMNSAQLMTLAMTCKLASKRWEQFDPKKAEELEKQANLYLDLLHKEYKGKTSKKDLKDKTDDLLKNALKEIEKYETNQGGTAVAKILADPKMSQAVLKGRSTEETLDKLVKSDEEHAKVVEAALKAQTNESGKRQHSKAFMKSGFTPYGFQQKYINWMLAVKRGINAADTAMGKTLQCIGVIDHLIETGKEKRGLIVMPPGLIAQWPEAIEKFRPGSKVAVIDADPDSKMDLSDRVKMLKAINEGREKPDFVLLSSGVLQVSKDRQNILMERMGIVLDEDNNIVSGGEEKNGKKLSASQQAQLNDMLAEDPLISELQKLQGAMFMDEAHKLGIKNPDNISHSLAKHVIGDREHAFLLTATPITNTPEDLFHQMELIHPGSAGGNEAKFKGKIGTWDRDPETGELVQTGYHGLKQLNNEVRPFVYARLKTEEEVARQMNLPKAHEHALALKMHPEQQKYYDEYRTKLVDAASRGGVDYAKHADTMQEMLMLAMQCKQMAISPKLLDPSYKGRSVKFDVTKELIRKHFADPKNIDHPILIYSAHPKAFEYLKQEIMDELGMDESLFGTISANAKGGVKGRAVTAEAINNGMKKILFAGYTSGGAGLNLQGVDITDPKTGKKRHVGPSAMILLDKSWSPFEVEQGIGRAVRPGQTEEVHITHLRTLDSYEDRVIEKLHGKVEAARGILYAHLGEDELNEVTQTAFSKIIKEFSAASNQDHPEFEDFTPRTQQETRDAMASVVGKDAKWKTNDEMLAGLFGTKLDSPEWKKKRAEIAKMDIKAIQKAVFVEGDLRKKLKDRGYLSMGHTRLRTRLSILELQYKDKECTKKHYDTQKAIILKDLDRWNASKAAKRVISDKEMDLGHAAMAAAAPGKGKKGKKSVGPAPVKVLNPKHDKGLVKNAPKQKAVVESSKPGWTTKQNPYKAKTDEGALFTRAQALGAKSKDDFVKKYTAHMSKILKKEGLTGKDFDSDLKFESNLAGKMWAKFVKDGHFVEKSMIVSLDEWLGAHDAR